MEHFDYVGLAILITVVVQGVVTIMAAIQSWRNGRDIQNVKRKVDGITDQLVEQARYTGVLEGSIDPVRPHDAPPTPPRGP